MQKSVAIQQLFERYGPIVRIGPGKVAFQDYAATKEVYTTQKFDKSVYYETFVLFVIRDEAAHTAHRKKFASHYTPTNINRFQPEVYNFVHQMIDGVFGFAETNTPIDCLAMIRHLSVDVLVDNAFGFQAASLTKWAAGEEDPLSAAIHDFPPLGVVFVITRLGEVRAAMVEGKLDSSDKWMTARLLEQQDSPTGMSQREVIAETVGHVIAGADTTSIGMGFMLWMLSQRPDIMQRLRDEVDHAMPDARMPPDIETLQDLPYLNARRVPPRSRAPTLTNITGLRLYSPVPSILEREVRGAQPFSLMGHALPPGTVVGTQAWSAHRDPQVYLEPLAFTPERWLAAKGNAERLARMHQQWMPFGLGSRTCVGQRLATMVMRVCLVSIVRNFDVVAPPETTPKSMTPAESFVCDPS
ncbi:hypothetical protein HWV62_11644 [Athelia sp. TMB]|nr:hypothetical protein HWV62_11644 [Athelia sp. TMB]